MLNGFVKTSNGVFSVYCKTKSSLTNMKDIELSGLVRYESYINAPKYNQIHSRRIYNDIANCYYSFKQMILFIMYNYLIDGKMPVMAKIKDKHIRELMRFFSDKQLKQDKELIKEIRKKTEIITKGDFIRALIPLIQDKYISPRYFFYIMRKNILTKKEEDVIFTNDKLKRFLFTLKKLQFIYSEVLHEQEKVLNRLENGHREN